MMGNVWTCITNCCCRPLDVSGSCEIGDDDGSGERLVEEVVDPENGGEESDKIKLNMLNYTSLDPQTNYGRNEELFVDTKFHFDCDDNVVFKRPKEISSNPSLIVDGVETSDVCQGQLGNCWWLAACATVLRSEKYREMIIPADNLDFNHKDYNGRFRFRFWDFNKWKNVVIDDRLPVLDGKLYYGRSSNPDEFWLPLLEKAFAKFLGSYKHLGAGGNVKDSLTDLTGGLSKTFKMRHLNPEKRQIFKLRLQKSLQHNAFVCAETGKLENNDLGLVEKHAYTVLEMDEARPHDNTSLSRIKLRNPYGRPENHTDLHAAEWWMTFDDFLEYFAEVTICLHAPDFNKDGEVDCADYYVSTIEGKWKPGELGGGFSIELQEPQDLKDNEETIIIVSLIQTGRRRVQNLDADTSQYLPISIYFPDKNGSSSSNNSSNRSNWRERIARFRLKKQLFPYKLYPNIHPDSFTTEEGYIARIYSTKELEIKKTEY